MMTKFATFAGVSVVLKMQWPPYETDSSMRTEIQNLGVLPNNPEAARISDLRVFRICLQTLIIG